MSLRSAVRAWLESQGLYVRRTSQLPYGVDWMLDARRILPQLGVTTIFDIGAHKGQTATRLRTIFPAAQIHSFEPIPSTFAVLSEALSSITGAHAHNLAMADESGRRQIHAVAGASTNSLASRRMEGDPNATKVEITCTTVDDFCQLHAIDQISVIKTDTEGLDVSVLRGAKRMLSGGSIQAICCETTFNRRDPEVSNFHQVEALLADHGIVPITIYPHAAAGFGVLGKFFDTLFVRDSLLPGWAKP